MQINTSHHCDATRRFRGCTKSGRVRIHPKRKTRYVVPDDRHAPYLYRGDILVMDPTLVPEPGDYVLTFDFSKDLDLGHYLETSEGLHVIDTGRRVKPGDNCKVVAVYRAR